MKLMIIRVFSVMMIFALIFPVTALGQMEPAGIAQTKFGSSLQNGPPPGFDPTKLKLSAHQPVIIGEVSSGRDELNSYIIILDDPAVPSYLGGIAGFQATNPKITNGEKLAANTASVRAYIGYLKSQQSQAIESFQSVLGRPIETRRQYVYALNGISVELTFAEASKIAGLTGVKDVQLDVANSLTTDVSPEWIVANQVWDGTATGGIGTKGEGVIIGIIDSGINMDHPSFAAVGDDGYSHINPLGHGNFLGWCNPSNPNYDPAYICNDKLIGAWDYADASWSGAGQEDDGPYDNDSHGSHVASTAAGNYIDQATLYAPTVRFADSVSGIAPHANIIAYDVCGATGSCYSSDVIAAIDQAIADGVDVINESIGLSGDPFIGPKQLAYLNAVAAGIFYTRAAGNEGPGAGTVGPEPAWTFSTAALTHNRKMLNYLTDMTGGTNPPPGSFEGLGFTAGYGPAEIVYSANFTETLKPGATAENARLCAMGNPDDDVFESPWEDGTFDGEIVVCDRGDYPRIEKGNNVQVSGAGGFVLADDGNGVMPDSHFIPGLHISYQDSITLKNWLDPTVVQTATITGYVMDYNAAYGDIMANFSSRGPADIDLIKPDAGAPGVEIWAAWSDRPGEPDDGEEYGFKDGTSMASPQTAGIAALIKSLHPTWTPLEIKSALMTTATRANTLKDEASQAPTNPFDAGSGRVRADRAVRAGLIFNETIPNFSAANEENVRNLNLPSFANGACFMACSWTRTATNSLFVPIIWTASLDIPNGVQMTLTPASFFLSPGESVDFTLSVSMTTASLEEWLFGSVTFTPNVSGVPDAYLPLAVYFADSTNSNVITKEASATEVAGSGLVDYTIRLANPGADAVSYILSDTIPVNTQYVGGSAWGGLNFVPSANTLNYQGSFIAPDIGLIPQPVWIGYYSLASLGVNPYDLPDDPDEGGWLIGGMDFYYLGAHYTRAIWSVNGTVEAGAESGLSTGYINMPMPYRDRINNLLAPWWADINFDEGGNWYFAELQDTTGNGYFVFEWENAPEYASGGSVTATFQVWMIAGTDYVWFAYDHIDPSWYAGGTVGIENISGQAGDQYYISSPSLNIPPTGTLPDNTIDLWVDFRGTSPVEMGFSVSANGPTLSRILNEVIVKNDLGEIERAWAVTTIQEGFGLWLPFLARGGAAP